MKQAVVFFLVLSAIVSVFAYEMGEYTKTFIDPSRPTRQIPTTIFYPIDTNNPLAVYPYIVYGHGYGGSCESYGYLTANIINLGWIIVYPRTEEDYSTDTENLALDMAFLKEGFYLENMNFTSPVFNKIDTIAIVGGYSMGGACAVAAANWEPSFASLVTLAAAPRTLLNLYPEAINMATGVETPSITYSGSTDWVASPTNNQIPIYNNLASFYKSFVSLTGVGHPEFYNNPLIYIILAPWLMYLRTGSVYYIDQFESVLNSYPAATLTWQHVDNLIVILDAPGNVSFNVENGILTISWDGILEAHGYKVCASEVPYTGFSEVTSQGTFTNGNRVSWTSTNLYMTQRFFYIKAYRD